MGKKIANNLKDKCGQKIHTKNNDQHEQTQTP